jgi:asparagine synthase (glutamine-hydrolysing)
MARELAHRGPDAQAVWTRGSVGLAHTRLSIIDVEGSPQPMTIGQHTIAYNGEVFDYQRVRAELVQRGCRFSSNGDTEVLLQLLATDGIDALNGIDAQYCFAWFDADSRVLRLVRDPAGILPLYYVANAKQLAFASEPKALLALMPEHRDVDLDSLAEYLIRRSVAAPHTLFKGIRKLEPGHVLAIEPGGRVTDSTYWSIPNREPDAGLSADDAIEQTHAALVRSVRNRLVADVPVGAYLSGGLDSSLIVAIARAQRAAPINTYSAGFGDARFDELPYARDVSTQLRTSHHEVTVGPDDFIALWEELTWFRDAPLSEPADVAVYKLAREARKDVKVILSGEGSDELFGGYPKYRAAKLFAPVDALLPNAVVRPLAEELQRRLPRGLAKLRIPLRALAAAPALRHDAWFSAFSDRDLASLAPRTNGRRDRSPLGKGDVIQQMLYADCHAWLSDNLLERGDRMSMAASVETRPPFVSRELFETAFKIPTRFKAGVTRAKWIVKEIARQYLPSRIVDRKKIGFRVPLDRWFRNDIQGFATDMLLSRTSFVSTALDRREVARIVGDHHRGHRDNRMKMWVLLSLELWHRKLIARS